MKKRKKSAIWFSYIPESVDVDEVFHSVRGADLYGNLYALHLNPTIKAKKKIKITIEEI